MAKPIKSAYAIMAASAWLPLLAEETHRLATHHGLTALPQQIESTLNTLRG